jgi:phenylalanyl-tRNA synthetase alpha chain
MASEIGDKILKYLADHGNSVDTQKLAELWNEDHQKIVGAVKSLQSLGDVSWFKCLLVFLDPKCLPSLF